LLIARLGLTRFRPKSVRVFWIGLVQSGSPAPIFSVAEESRVVKLIKEATEHLSVLQAQKADHQKKLENAQALLSPIRYMPPELLGSVFVNAFEEEPLVAWR
jgi:hypothetical protein